MTPRQLLSRLCPLRSPAESETQNYVNCQAGYWQQNSFGSSCLCSLPVGCEHYKPEHLQRGLSGKKWSPKASWLLWSQALLFPSFLDLLLPLDFASLLWHGWCVSLPRLLLEKSLSACQTPHQGPLLWAPVWDYFETSVKSNVHCVKYQP